MNARGIPGHAVPTVFNRFRIQRGLAFGVIIITALFAFEIFNYSTTDYALGDLLGELKFMGVHWSTILAIAFCGIDFAGIARLFTPELDSGNSQGMNEVWYLFGAWLLAATMNAMLTWWGVSLAILNHQTLGNVVIQRETLLRAVPIFVAVMVWLIRVLIIGTFSVAGDRLFSQAEQHPQAAVAVPRVSSVAPALRSLSRAVTPRAASAQASLPRSFNRPSGQLETGHNRPEPTYHPVSASSNASSNGANPPLPRPSVARPGTSVRR